MKLSKFECDLIGQRFAHEAAWRAAIKTHPDPMAVAQELLLSRERGLAAWLASPTPDLALEAFETECDRLVSELRGVATPP